VKLDFRRSMHCVRARMLWQALFNLYREHGAPLERMDNMLIDLRNCYTLFDRLAYRTYEEFMWGCCSKHFVTTWIEPEAGTWTDEQAAFVAAFSHVDHYYHVKITYDEATITKISPEED